MTSFEITVDFNGIVLFDHKGLESYFGGIDEGANLYRRFTTTDDGEAVVAQGLVTPVLGLNDSIYKVYVRMASEPSALQPGTVILSNGCFPLRIHRARHPCRHGCPARVVSGGRLATR